MRGPCSRGIEALTPLKSDVRSTHPYPAPSAISSRDTSFVMALRKRRQPCGQTRRHFSIPCFRPLPPHIAPKVVGFLGTLGTPKRYGFVFSFFANAPRSRSQRQTRGAGAAGVACLIQLVASSVTVTDPGRSKMETPPVTCSKETMPGRESDRCDSRLRNDRHSTGRACRPRSLAAV
jgi:hypothetical protein